MTLPSANATAVDISRITEIVSATPVKPTYIRFKMRSADGQTAVFWVSSSILGAHLKAGGAPVGVVVKAIKDSLDTQDLFRQMEREFVLLEEFLKEVEIGTVKDLFLEGNREGNDVSYSIGFNENRLCIHSLAPDGLTRLFVARSGDDKGYEWRLEYFPPGAQSIKEAAKGVISDDNLASDLRPALFRWALACLTGPFVPPPASR